MYLTRHYYRSYSIFMTAAASLHGRPWFLCENTGCDIQYHVHMAATAWFTMGNAIMGHLTICLSVLAALVLRVGCSEGDRNAGYSGCLFHCRNTGCAPFAAQPHKCRQARACTDFNYYPPQELQVFQWSCVDDCKWVWQMGPSCIAGMLGGPSQMSVSMLHGAHLIKHDQARFTRILLGAHNHKNMR